MVEETHDLTRFEHSFDHVLVGLNAVLPQNRFSCLSEKLCRSIQILDKSLVVLVE